MEDIRFLEDCMELVHPLLMPFNLAYGNCKTGGKVYQQRYERGKIITPLEVIGTCRKSDTGTNVQFLPDPEIFDKTYFKAAMVRNRLHETAYLNQNLRFIM